MLLPLLQPGDIIVTNNPRSHHVKSIRKVPRTEGMDVLYLPPYNLTSASLKNVIKGQGDPALLEDMHSKFSPRCHPKPSCLRLDTGLPPLIFCLCILLVILNAAIGKINQIRIANSSFGLAEGPVG